MTKQPVERHETTMRDMVQRLTGGRPYIFLVMSFQEERKPVYDLIRRITEQRFNMACIRADELTFSGYDLLAKIHLLVDRAEVVVAEISELSANVFYEIGYAVGIKKPPLLLIEKGRTVPTDLKGLEVIEYKNTMGGIASFERDFSAHLKFRLDTELAVLRDMLEAPNPHPSYIISSPKYPGKQRNRIRANIYDARTFGDHLGILGLISAFASMWGVGKGVELISAQHSRPDLLDQDMSLYLIGSRKVSPPSQKMLEKVMAGKSPAWDVLSPEGKVDVGMEWEGVLWRFDGGRGKTIPGIVEKIGDRKEDVWTTDYGVIVRTPHPDHAGRLAFLMFGAHSLGTGAACLAATRPYLIQEIRSKLPEHAMEDKDSAFWVLVKGTVNRSDYLLDPEGVTIVDAGVYA